MYWLFCFLLPQLINGLGIRLFESKGGAGSNYNFPPPFGSSCFNLPSSWKNKASSIDSQGACVKLWSRAGCNGDSTLVAPGTLYHGDLSRLSRNSNGDWDKNVEAMSACTVSLFTDENLRGSNTELPIPTSHCLDLNEEFKNKVSSMDTNGMCVRIWFYKGCKSFSHQLDSGMYTSLDNVNSKRSPVWTRNFEAISDCNIHFFAEGGYHYAQTKTDRCIWLPPKNYTSINPQGRCVKIYNEAECEGESAELGYDSEILRNLTNWEYPVKSAYVYECRD